eukprot:3019055-Rhodomonas_salina.2
MSVPHMPRCTAHAIQLQHVAISQAKDVSEKEKTESVAPPQLSSALQQASSPLSLPSSRQPAPGAPVPPHQNQH